MKQGAPWAIPPALVREDHDEASIFHPAGLLREARRQRGLRSGRVPAVCLLDPDGDVVRHLASTGLGQKSDVWACYHTDLWETMTGEERVGVVGQAVGAPFAVLVAEELFVSGCEFLISVTSSGQLDPALSLPATILVDHALRGEGTSYAYLPPSPFVKGDAALLASVEAEVKRSGIPVVRGGTWTTDAPFRETRTAVTAAADAGLKAIEMEIAGLYAFAAAKKQAVVCFALVTNEMAQSEGDFEKGPDNGAGHALSLVDAAARAWRATPAAPDGAVKNLEAK